MTEVMLDRRVRKTRQSIQDAVLELLEESDLTGLSVQNITRRADVNRATFYQHYRDRDELLEQTFDALIAELSEECGPFVAGDEALVPEIVPPSFEGTFRAMLPRAGLYGRLLSLESPNLFASRFRTYCEALILEALKSRRKGESPECIPSAVRARYAASAGLGVIEQWILGGCAESPGQMAEWVWRLSAPVWFDECP